jgi:hypothetical protein
MRYGSDDESCMQKWSDTQTYALRVDVQQQRQSEPLHLRDTSNFYYLNHLPSTHLLHTLRRESLI